MDFAGSLILRITEVQHIELQWRTKISRINFHSCSKNCKISESPLEIFRLYSISTGNYNYKISQLYVYVYILYTVTALIFTVLIFHEFTNWTLFAILFSQIRIDIRPFKVGNGYYLEYSRLYFHELLTFS